MDINQHILPTPDMIRSARGYLNWSQHELGLKCNLSKVSLVGIESGRQKPNHETLKRIGDIFLNEGITFLPEGGFRVEKNIIKILEGNDSIKSFFDDVYITALKENSEFLISNAREELFIEAQRQSGIETLHRERMSKLKRKPCKVLLSILDSNASSASYAEYKKVPSEFFSENVPFYIYGQKLAIIIWKPEIRIIILKDPFLLEAYKKQFYYIWENIAK